MLYGGRISLAVGVAAMLIAIIGRHHHGRDRRSRRRRHRSHPDADHRSLPVPASAPAPPAHRLPVPRRPEEGPRTRGRRLRPDRRRDRRAALDAGGAAGPRPVPVAAREGVRGGRARPRRAAAAPGRPPHPAQRGRPGHRGRHHRRGRRHHRGVVARPSWGSAFRPTSRPGAASSSTPRTTSTSPRTGPSSRAPPSSSPCSASTTSATASATPSTPARFYPPPRGARIPAPPRWQTRNPHRPRRASVPDRDLCFVPATELQRLYRTRKASPLEVMQAVLARIDAVNPRAQRLRHGGAGVRARGRAEGHRRARPAGRARRRCTGCRCRSRT